MSSPPSYDDDLLTRLNALKKTTISLEQQKPSLNISQEPISHEDALSARLKSLRNGGNLKPATPKATKSIHQDSSCVAPNVDFDQEDGLPSLLKLSQPSSAWDVSDVNAIGAQSFQRRADAMLERLKLSQSAAKDSQEAADVSIVPVDEVDPAEVKSLQTKADALLARMTHYSTASRKFDDATAAHEGGNASMDADLDTEAQEAEELLAQLMDEVHLEGADEDDDEEGETPDESTRSQIKSNTSDITRNDKDPPTINNRSSAQHQPPDEQITDSDSAFEVSIKARMAALNPPTSTPEFNANSSNLPSPPATLLDSLGLPSAPTTLPSKASKPPSKPKEPEDWCNVCYDSATIICHGCDDEYYCATCWKEGHVGPHVDWEDRGHEWSRYRRPR